jgi:hypothetical protein
MTQSLPEIGFVGIEHRSNCATADSDSSSTPPELGGSIHFACLLKPTQSDAGVLCPGSVWGFANSVFADSSRLTRAKAQVETGIRRRDSTRQRRKNQARPMLLDRNGDARAMCASAPSFQLHRLFRPSQPGQSDPGGGECLPDGAASASERRERQQRAPANANRPEGATLWNRFSFPPDTPTAKQKANRRDARAKKAQ